MTGLLNRAYAMTTLGASLALDTGQAPPGSQGVHIEVDLPDGAVLQRDLPLEDLGVPLDLKGIDRALAAGRRLCLPSTWQEQLRKALGPMAPDEPLWLDFRRPFGHLPAMPWERLLQPEIGVPILRLPFSAIPATTTTEALRVVVCAPSDGSAALREYLAAVIPVLPGARFDVFARDHEAKSAVPAGAWVMFHAPPSENPVPVEASSLSDDPLDEEELANPWLAWMTETMAGQSIDVLHVICGARVSPNYGLLDFGLSPTGTEDISALRLVSVAQLLACLTQLGAWSLSLAMADTEALHAHGEAGLRIFAHRMTGLLSGPVTVQAPARGHADELAAACRFLYTPGPHTPPLAPTLAVACHPSLAQSRTGHQTAPSETRQLAHELESTVQGLTVDADVLEAARRDPRGSAWVASSQRLLERWTSKVVGGYDPTSVVPKTSEGVTDALSFISGVIESSVRGRADNR